MKSSNINRIATNSVLLYVRTVFVMIITLYTSRIILQIFGVDDFGIYSVVTSVVTMFSVFSGAFSSAIIRFITYELRNTKSSKISEIFWSSIIFQLFVSIFSVFIIFSVGEYILIDYLNVPESRIDSARFVFICSTAIFGINLLIVPLQAEVISHECMGVYSLFSSVDALFKLTAAYGLTFATTDTLTLYSLELLLNVIIQFILYCIFCFWTFKECRCLKVDFNCIKEISFFAGWNFFGCGAYVFNTQGINIISNIFFGVMVNAVRGIAMQVEAAVMQFVNSFTMALNPQITKSYAAGDTEYMMELVYRGAKYSYLLLLVFAVPFLLEADTILRIWLGTPPDYAADFVRLSILVAMASILSQTMITAMLATGRIKQYQIVVGTVYALVFPLSWIAFQWGCPADTAYYIYFAVNCVCLVIRLYMLKPLIPISATEFIRRTLLKVLPITALTFVIPGLVCYAFEPSFLRLVAVCGLSLVSTVGLSYALALDPQERLFLRGAVAKVVRRLHR